MEFIPLSASSSLSTECPTERLEAKKRRRTLSVSKSHDDQHSLSIVPSLTSLCLNVVVASLEKYPAESFGMLSENIFESIIQLRHSRTTPKEGSGGLDGCGRVAPALSDKFISEVEAANSHLAESVVVDSLVWKDCVQYRFRSGGWMRPSALHYPWPLLIDKIRSRAEFLLNSNFTDVASVASAIACIDILEEYPMNISLLQATGAGKTIRKAIKAIKKEKLLPEEALERLERILNSWISMVDQEGNVALSHSCTSNKVAVRSPKSIQNTKKDLQLAETCVSWRQLFHALKQRVDSRTAEQGERMRKSRTNLARDRPKIVKVRPAASAQHNRILSRAGTGNQNTNAVIANPASSKMSQLLRAEAAAAALRNQQREPLFNRNQSPRLVTTITACPSKKIPAISFGSAVAYATAASNSKQTKTRSNPMKKSIASTTQVQLGKGKLMNIPTALGVTKGAAKFRLGHR